MTIPENQAQITVGLKLTSSLITDPSPRTVAQNPPPTHPRKTFWPRKSSENIFLLRAASCLDEFTAQESQKPDNQDKNRYPNIIAFDHTRWPLAWTPRNITLTWISWVFHSCIECRVRLRRIGSGTTTAKEKDEYLNANYVDGFRRSRAYIATQGPMASTTELFWRMVRCA